MDRYGVIGNPVEHSRSPFIHRQFALACAQAIDYSRLPCEQGGFEAAVRAFAASGARGCNVTVPFKFEAARLGARLSERAALAGAANTLRFDAEGWFADNTDGAGLVRDIGHNAQFAIAGRRVLLIGAGGAAAGALGALLRARPAALTLANRSVEKARGLVDAHARLAATEGVALQATTLAGCGEGFALVVNASASSLARGAVPVAPGALGRGALVLDMMYGPAAAPFLAWACAHGAQTRDGLGMLVEQAAEAFFVWRGMRPETAPVLAALRERWEETA